MYYGKPTVLPRPFLPLERNGTTVRTEILAGITTFMTMAYILAVNPTIMSAAGMDKGAVLTQPPWLPLSGRCAWPFSPTIPSPWHRAWA